MVDSVPHSRPTTGLEECEAATRVIQSGFLAPGSERRAFQTELAEMAGVGRAIALQSGSAALHLALLALGIGPGKRIAIPSYTCAAVGNAVDHTGAEWIPLDVDPTTGNLTPDVVVAAGQVDAVVAPHMFGAPCDIAAIRECGVPVVEDCAMTFGAKPYGSLGDLAVVSFYATKMFTTGQGGAVLTDDDVKAEQIDDLVRYDNREDYAERFNYPLSDLASAVGREQLRRLPGFIKQRQKIAERYTEALSGTGAVCPDPAEGRHLYYRYLVQLPAAADPVIEKMLEEGIEVKRPVYQPLHRYRGLSDADYPGAVAIHTRGLSLPIYPSLTEEEIDRVLQAAVTSIREVYG